MAKLGERIASRLPEAPFTSAQTLIWFGVYLAIVALALFAVPRQFLSLFWMPAPTDGWVRVLAIPLFNLSVVVIFIGRVGSRELMRLTCITRSWVIPTMAVLVVAGLTSPVILLFGVVDIVCAALTLWALTTEARAVAIDRGSALAA